MPLAFDTNVFTEQFDGTSLEPATWRINERINRDGSVWTYSDAGAETAIVDNTLQVSIPAFSTRHDVTQGLDNAKHLYLTSRAFEIPPTGGLRVSARMAAVKHGGNADDFRDGVASLNLIDYGSGLIFDVVTTGVRTGAIYERVPCTAPGTFTYLVDAPLHCPPARPGHWQHVAIELNAQEQSAHFFVGSVEVFRCQPDEMPKSVVIGMGLMTVWPLDAAGSSSAHGQGITGRWSTLSAAVALG